MLSLKFILEEYLGFFCDKKNTVDKNQNFLGPVIDNISTLLIDLNFLIQSLFCYMSM